jgi:hypothetical protein
MNPVSDQGRVSNLHRLCRRIASAPRHCVRVLNACQVRRHHGAALRSDMHCSICNERGRQLRRPITELAALDCVVVVTTRCGRLNQISEEIMYKFAIAILLLSAPAFAQDKSEVKPNMPPTNMKNTVIPKSGGEQTPATTPTTAAEANRPDATATRPAKTGPEQTSVPNASPPATTTQTTGATNQEPKVKEMNEEEKKKIEKEGK